MADERVGLHLVMALGTRRGLIPPSEEWLSGGYARLQYKLGRGGTERNPHPKPPQNPHPRSRFQRHSTKLDKTIAGLRKEGCGIPNAAFPQRGCVVCLLGKYTLCPARRGFISGYYLTARARLWHRRFPTHSAFPTLPPLGQEGLSLGKLRSRQDGHRFSLFVLRIWYCGRLPLCVEVLFNRG